jgi:DNA-dependent protein kinase catalytic subunit
MDVFIQEPLIDWLKNAKQEGSKEVAVSESASSHGSSGGASAAAVATAWYPARKIDIARRKLNLAHPALVTCDELATGKLADKHPFIDRVMDIVRGDPADSARLARLFLLFGKTTKRKQNLFGRGAKARGGQNCDSVAEQVAFLLEQATDPNILGRTWGGWEPWV